MIKQILIGITGGIGSGKSLVSDYLKSRGEYVISADEVAREAVLPGETGNELIRKEFGVSYFNDDGTLNRKKLAAFVFDDSEKLSMLNGILHPVIIDRIYKKAKSAGGRVFIEAPLLIQSGMHKAMDHVWLVTADKEARIKRVMNRDGDDRASVERRIANQMSDCDMAGYADEVIDNSASIEALHEKIDALLKKLSA